MAGGSKRPLLGSAYVPGSDAIAQSRSSRDYEWCPHDTFQSSGPGEGESDCSGQPAGLESNEMRLPRLFVAVWPSDEACVDLSVLPRKDQPGFRFVPEENWHVTLRFLGDAHPREVAEALDGVTFPSTEVHLGPVVEYLGDDSLIVHATGCETLNGLVNRATAHLGDTPIRQRFVGHVTVARLGRGASNQRSRWGEPAIVGMAFSSSFIATEVVLAQSHLESDGARYEIVARWPTV